MDQTAAKTVRRAIGDALHPHVNEVVRMGTEGNIAVLVLHPADGEPRAAARVAGWDGRSDPAVFQMANHLREWVAKNSDAVTAAWLLRDTKHPRIFVFMDGGTFLLNVGAHGYYFEPGSLDSQSV